MALGAPLRLPFVTSLAILEEPPHRPAARASRAHVVGEEPLQCWFIQSLNRQTRSPHPHIQVGKQRCRIECRPLVSWAVTELCKRRYSTQGPAVQAGLFSGSRSDFMAASA